MEGELAVASYLVNLFEDRGVDPWLGVAGRRGYACMMEVLRGQQEERRAVTNTALTSELEDHQLISVNSDLPSTAI